MLGTCGDKPVKCPHDKLVYIKGNTKLGKTWRMNMCQPFAGRTFTPRGFPLSGLAGSGNDSVDPGEVSILFGKELGRLSVCLKLRGLLAMPRPGDFIYKSKPHF